MEALTFDSWSKDLKPVYHIQDDIKEWFKVAQIENPRGDLIKASDVLSVDQMNVWHKILHIEREAWMRKFFESRIMIKEHHKKSMREIRKEGTLACPKGQEFSLYTSTGFTKFVRNVQYWDVSSVPLCGRKHKRTPYHFTEAGILKTIWQRGHIPSTVYKKIFDYDSLRVGCTMFSQQASLFPPETIGCIIDRVLQAKHVFFPVCGWLSYLLGFSISKATQGLALDANPFNVKKNQALATCLGKTEECFQIYEAVTETVEPWDLLKFCGGFDGIFWSPPYFTRELYPGSNQSHHYKSYTIWKDEFYFPVLQLCAAVLTRLPARMVIVISDQTVGDDFYPLVADTIGLAFKAGFQLQSSHRMCVYNCRTAKKSSKDAFETMLVFQKPIYCANRLKKRLRYK